MKFREHRGGLQESMNTCVDVKDRKALVSLIQRRFPHARADMLRVDPYGRDDRVGWDTHIVTIAGYGVVGFTDGPADERTSNE